MEEEVVISSCLSLRPSPYVAVVTAFPEALPSVVLLPPPWPGQPC